MNNHIIKQWLIGWVLVLPLSALGQEKDAGVLSALWEYVEHQYAGVSAKQALLLAERFEIQAVKAKRLPQLNAQAQNNYGSFQGSSGGFFPQPGQFNVSAPPLSKEAENPAFYTYASGTLEWDVFTFGAQKRRVESAQAKGTATAYELQAYLLGLKETLSQRYIAWLYRKCRLQLLDAQRQRLEHIGKITGGLAAAGLRPAADSLLASSGYARALGSLQADKGKARAARIKLTELFGDPAPELSSGDPARDFKQPPPPRNDTVFNVQTSHPALKPLQNKARNYQLQSAARGRERFPALRLLGGYAYRGTGIYPEGEVSGSWKDGFSHSSTNFLLGVGLVWNLSNLYTAKQQINALQARATSLKMEHLRYAGMLRADVRSVQSEFTHSLGVSGCSYTHHGGTG